MSPRRAIAATSQFGTCMLATAMNCSVASCSRNVRCVVMYGVSVCCTQLSNARRLPAPWRVGEAAVRVDDDLPRGADCGLPARALLGGAAGLRREARRAVLVDLPDGEDHARGDAPAGRVVAEVPRELGRVVQGARLLAQAD